MPWNLLLVLVGVQRLADDWQMPSQIAKIELTHLRELEILLNTCFSTPPKHSFFDDFPIWSSFESKDVRVVGIRSDSKKLLASCGVRFAQLRRGSEEFTIAVMGAVATAPDARGKGLATQLVNHVLDLARERKCEAAFLWGSEHALYGRLGFTLQGEQWRLPISHFAGSGAKELTLTKSWNPKIIDTIKLRKTGLKEDTLGASLKRKHTHVEWHWAEDQGRFAFVGFHRGIDLKNVIHEWGGDKDCLVQVLTTLAKSHPQLEIYLHPSHLDGDFVGVTKTDSKFVKEKLALCCPLEKSFAWKEPTWFWGLDSA